MDPTAPPLAIPRLRRWSPVAALIGLAVVLASPWTQSPLARGVDRMDVDWLRTLGVDTPAWIPVVATETGDVPDGSWMTEAWQRDLPEFRRPNLWFARDRSLAGTSVAIADYPIGRVQMFAGGLWRAHTLVLERTGLPFRWMVRSYPMGTTRMIDKQSTVRVRPAALAGNLVVVMVVAFAVGCERDARHRRRALRAGECPRCRYPRPGRAISRCPECGFVDGP